MYASAVLFLGVVSGALGCTVLGCTVPGDLLQDRACPCLAGYRCVAEDNRCVPDDGRDAGPRDGGSLDAGSLDAGSLDAALDAAPDAARDSAVPDAGPAGPVASFPCEALDGAFLRDRSGHGRDARCDGAGCPDIVPGRVGNACDFTAESRRLRVSYDPVFMPGARSGAPETLTVAFWVYFHDPAPEAFASSSAIGLPAGSGSANVWQSYFSTASDPPLAGFISADDAAIRSLYAPEPILLERWIHLALVYDRGTKLLFFDGVEAARTEGETLRVSNQDVLIGADENDGSVLVFPLRGMLDEILLYDRALTPDEIQALASPG